MTAAPLFAPVQPSGTSPARPPQGGGASDIAGLFALLLAGTHPLRPAHGHEPPPVQWFRGLRALDISV